MCDAYCRTAEIFFFTRHSFAMLVYLIPALAGHELCPERDGVYSLRTFSTNRFQRRSYFIRKINHTYRTPISQNTKLIRSSLLCTKKNKLYVHITKHEYGGLYNERNFITHDRISLDQFYNEISTYIPHLYIFMYLLF